MVWLMLATLVVVFVIGFRVLTSGPRRAVRRISERLAIEPVVVESMTDQMGRSAGGEFLRYLARPNDVHLQNAVQVLLIWQAAIIDDSEHNLQHWLRLLRKARMATPLSDGHIRLAMGFLRELEPDLPTLKAFQARYNQCFTPQDGVLWLH
ncbi:DUF1198 domain-containing protein [Shimwellia blattae]|uniref:DUF1198 domain-containing protein n=1 Tax=Shimwellia blattae (strain ATCC 29907 / DSM 4481 / JCM 1650 / NBRC 105725 / CDC 9005-74) TaxID=630626 RepID=I2BA72_SHIBC|nr:DUF1198 domain-containing protein [Shimwellia blattae]AFJ47426.1 hypothetical protein EBL_c23370 [Shimwellia blattae DSM 4481 = NBRC 105725]GAB80382.1 hypothetical protein YicN [Shimwellia blattae DSM 4481 = NBRC 105725]VDY64923.1 Protein of uncharacterised function (DUF1198) [Shimwellia blattae]VEC23121.1 Protein of uncharacterised function (DUF1198) [Shimwellia blattae]